jgi:hypothetical protein
MKLARRGFGFTLVCLVLSQAGCGSGASSTLKTVTAGTGSGPIRFEVENKTDVPINNLYMAKTEAVSAALAKKVEPGSGAEQDLWGDDHLTRGALEVGGRMPVEVKEAGRWDVRALDRDGRYQHVTSLKIEAGGRYILELGEGGWRMIQ